MKKSILLFAVISLFYILNNITNAQTPNWTWAKNTGGISKNMATSVAVDASGNIYLVGYFLSSTIIFGSYTLTNAGEYDLFIAKYDANGNVVWAKSVGGIGDDFEPYVALDASGNVYVAGSFRSSTITFGADILTNSGDYDILLLKYDVNGNALWAKSFGGIGDDEAGFVAIDASGNPYIVGWFNSPTLSFGLTTLTNAGGYDLFITKYDTNGNVLWAKSAGGTSDDYAYSVAVDASGNAYVAGSFSSSTITFGIFLLSNAGMDDVLLAKYDTNGNVIWALDAGGIYQDAARSVVVDTSGNIYLAGLFGSPVITFGSTLLRNVVGENLYDIFLVKYGTNGNMLWAKSAGGTSDDNAQSIVADASGNTYVAGYFGSSTITFGSDTLTSSGEYDIFLTKYDVNGNALWAKSAGGTRSDFALSVVTDASGNIYLAGFFYSSTLIFGSSTLTKEGTNTDLFIAKLSNSSGIYELSNSSNISVLPNPARDKITIEISTVPYKCELSIMNMSSQELITHQIIEPKTQIDISTLPSGVYFVRLTGERKVQVGKFLKL